MDNIQMETTHPKQLDDSALDRIPTNWEVTNLGNSFDELYRYPTYYGIEYVESGIPEVRGTMGKIAMVPERLRGAVITANLIRMKFTKSMVVPEWARHFLRSGFFQDALDLATSATTIKTIQVPALCAITFWRPPTKEQHCIAEILDTIDEAIQKTEALISKLKAMKQGLLHDLLTRGLDKNGKLRDPKAHPEQFKNSPLGRIPKDWGVNPLEKLAEVDRGKFTHRPRNDPRFYGGAYPFVQTGDIVRNILKPLTTVVLR
jgi:type I restriction enzyme S subunit